MNDIKFANFPSLFNLNKTIIVKENCYLNIFAGMYTLTILVTDGFKGVEELKLESEKEFVDKIRREIKRTLKRQNEEKN